MPFNRLSNVRRPSSFIARVRGQGMTEYLVILGLIAIAAIGVFSFFGQTMRSQIAGMAQEVGGKTGTADVTAAQAAAGKATTNAAVNMNMSTYTSGGNSAAGGQ